MGWVVEVEIVGLLKIVLGAVKDQERVFELDNVEEFGVPVDDFIQFEDGARRGIVFVDELGDDVVFSYCEPNRHHTFFGHFDLLEVCQNSRVFDIKIVFRKNVDVFVLDDAPDSHRDEVGVGDDHCALIAVVRFLVEGCVSLDVGLVFLEVKESLGGVTTAAIGEVKGIDGGGDGKGGVYGDSE